MLPFLLNSFKSAIVERESDVTFETAVCSQLKSFVTRVA